MNHTCYRANLSYAFLVSYLIQLKMIDFGRMRMNLTVGRMDQMMFTAIVTFNIKLDPISETSIERSCMF